MFPVHDYIKKDIERKSCPLCSGALIFPIQSVLSPIIITHSTSIKCNNCNLCIDCSSRCYDRITIIGSRTYVMDFKYGVAHVAKERAGREVEIIIKNFVSVKNILDQLNIVLAFQ